MPWSRGKGTALKETKERKKNHIFSFVRRSREKKPLSRRDRTICSVQETCNSQLVGYYSICSSRHPLRIVVRTIHSFKKKWQHYKSQVCDLRDSFLKNKFNHREWIKKIFNSSVSQSFTVENSIRSKKTRQRAQCSLTTVVLFFLKKVRIEGVFFTFVLSDVREIIHNC